MKKRILATILSISCFMNLIFMPNGGMVKAAESSELEIIEDSELKEESNNYEDISNEESNNELIGNEEQIELHEPINSLFDSSLLISS